MFSQGQSSQQHALESYATGLLGKHPAGIGLLEGGRNSLLESAQQATLMSVPTSSFHRQLNSLGRRAGAGFATANLQLTTEAMKLSRRRARQIYDASRKVGANKQNKRRGP
jgi:hypothetical protein